MAQLSGLWPQHGTAVLRQLRESGHGLMLWLLQELEPALGTFCDLARAEGWDLNTFYLVECMLECMLEGMKMLLTC